MAGWGNAWGGAWGGAPAATGGGLMGPWSTAWGMSPDAATVQAQGDPLAALRAMAGTNSGGDSPGFSVGGDPANAMQTSQATKDRVRDSLVGGFGTSLGKTALGVGGALAAGMPSKFAADMALNSLAGMKSVGGILGNTINSALGTKPESFLGKALSFAAPTAAGFALGPVGGLLGGMFGGVIADGIMDLADVRKNEALKDDIENRSNEVKGRMTVKDMKDVMEKVNKNQAAVSSAVNTVNKARAMAGISPIGYSPTRMSLDTIAPRGYGLGGTGSSNTRSGWGGYDPGHASTGFGLGGRSSEVARGALDGLGFGGFGFGGGSDNDRDTGGFGANDGNSDTAGNAGYGR